MNDQATLEFNRGESDDALNLANYAFLWQDPLYRNAYLNSLLTAGVSTILCLLILDQNRKP